MDDDRRSQAWRQDRNVSDAFASLRPASDQLGIIGLIPAARAGGLDQAALRGSSAYGRRTGLPGHRLRTTLSGLAGALLSGQLSGRDRTSATGCDRTAGLAAHNFTFEFGTRIWYSTGTLAKDCTTIRASAPCSILA